jgi:hypothetical protein
VSRLLAPEATLPRSLSADSICRSNLAGTVHDGHRVSSRAVRGLDGVKSSGTFGRRIVLGIRKRNPALPSEVTPRSVTSV